MVYCANCLKCKVKKGTPKKCICIDGYWINAYNTNYTVHLKSIHTIKFKSCKGYNSMGQPQPFISELEEEYR